MWGVTMAEAEEAMGYLLAIQRNPEARYLASPGTAFVGPAVHARVIEMSPSPFHLVALDCPKCGIPVDPPVASQLRAGGVGVCQGCGMTLVGER